MKISALLHTLLLFSMTFVALPIMAEDKQIHGFVSAGTFVNNDYEGSDEYQVNPAGVARLQYKHYYLQTEGLGAKINLSSLKNFEFGPVFNYSMSRDDDIENEAVSKMEKIDGSFEGGVFVRSQKKNILTGGDEIGFEVKALTDLSDTHDGTLISVSTDYSYQSTPKLRLTTSLEATYADDDYMDTYFGINARNRGTSGLPNFTAEGGIKDIELSVMANYQFSDKWGVLFITGYKQLLGDAKDSPLVEQEGNNDQLQALTGLSYRF